MRSSQHHSHQTHRSQRSHTQAHSSRQQRLEEELRRLRQDFDHLKALYLHAQQEMETARVDADCQHQQAIAAQAQHVQHLYFLLQSKQMQRITQHQPVLTHAQHLISIVLAFLAGLFGANLLLSQQRMVLHEQMRRRDQPGEEERVLMTLLQQEGRMLDALQFRLQPAETPDLRQARDKVRSMQQYLTSLFRQIRTKEIELESEKAVNTTQRS